MAEVKTKPTTVTVDIFLSAVEDEQAPSGSNILVKLMTDLTGEPATMWGTAIIGFGKHHYKYESGHEKGYLPDRLFAQERKTFALCVGRL